MGRQLRGGVPVPETLLQVHNQWQDNLAHGERMMAQKASELEEISGENCRQLDKVAVGQRMSVQNAVIKLWDRTGVVTRVLRSSRQYTIRLDGSGRMVLRNWFLRPMNAAIEEERQTPTSSNSLEAPVLHRPCDAPIVSR